MKTRKRRTKKLSQLLSLKKAVAFHIAAIAKHRDALKDIAADIDEVVDACDDAKEAMESFNYAIERLSENL